MSKHCSKSTQKKIDLKYKALLEGVPFLVMGRCTGGPPTMQCYNPIFVVDASSSTDLRTMPAVDESTTHADNKRGGGDSAYLASEYTHSAYIRIYAYMIFALYSDPNFG